jgi:hypothetical protein
VNRTVGIPAAAIVLVALPSLVVQPTEPEAPPAKEAALTVNLEGDQGGGSPYDLSLTAEGPPPTKASTLRDASGLHTAKVAPASDCEGPIRVGFPGGRDRWCLRLEDVADGHELTGVATGGGSGGVGKRELTLTVNRRDSFVGLPLAVMLVGFLAGAIAALYRAALRKPVRRTVLDKLLRRNSRAGGERQIVGLDGFARDRLAAGEAINEVIAKVDGVVEDGPERAATARASLKQAVEGAQAELDTYPVWRAAAEEAARTGNKIGDFYAEDATVRTHPATQCEGMLKQMREHVARLAPLREEIAGLAAESRTAAEALARAELVASLAATVAEVARVGELLDDARDEVEKARAHEATKLRPERLAVRTRGRKFAEEEEVPASSGAAELGGGGLGRTEIGAIALTAIACLAILGLAVVTVKQAAYDPKLTFATATDYVTLFLAALGSSAAGSVLLLLSLWSPVPPTED